MLKKKELDEIKERFEAGGADKPLRIEGDHANFEGLPGPVSLGWHVKGTSKIGGKEVEISYANHTTFEAATFLIHLPVDMGNMLSDLRSLHALLAKVVEGNEEAIDMAKHIVGYFNGKIEIEE